MTYEEIEAEVNRFDASGGRSASPGAKTVYAAFLQHMSGLAIVEHCPYCNTIIEVLALGSSAWSVSCRCGRSQTMLRGL